MWRAREENSVGVFLFSFCVPVILGLIIFHAAAGCSRRNRAFAIRKVKAKRSRGTPKITSPTGGVRQAEAGAREIIDFLKDPQKFQRLGGRLPKAA